MSRTSRMTRSPAPLHEQLEAAAESAAEPGALHAVEGSHRPDGEMNRSERIGFWSYVAMGIFCGAVVVAAAISAIAS